MESVVRATPERAKRSEAEFCESIYIKVGHFLILQKTGLNVQLIPENLDYFSQIWLYGFEEEGFDMVKFVLFGIYPTDGGDNIRSVQENSARGQLRQFFQQWWDTISKICLYHPDKKDLYIYNGMNEILKYAADES